jgi:hypothetical protein
VKRLLVLVLIVVAFAAALGFYRGWFNLSTEGSNHEADMTISVDRDKIRADEEKVKKSVQEIGHKPTEKIGDSSASGERHHEEPQEPGLPGAPAEHPQ